VIIKIVQKVRVKRKGRKFCNRVADAMRRVKCGKHNGELCQIAMNK